LSIKLAVNQAEPDGISLNPDGFDLLKPAWMLGFGFFSSYIFYWALCTQPKIWIPNSQNRSMSVAPYGVEMMPLRGSFIGPTGLTKGSLRLLDTARYSRAKY
jgi:hypothetical protein